jgi:hypothetical protein
MLYKRLKITAAWAALFLMCGCSGPKLADVTYDICLSEMGTTEDIVDIFRNTAAKYEYKFHDNGSVQLENLKRIDTYTRPLPIGVPVSFIIAQADGGILISGGNLNYESTLTISFFYRSGASQNPSFYEDIFNSINSIPNSNILIRDKSTQYGYIELNDICNR